MSYFAQVKNGIVQNVIVADQNFINTLPDFNDWIETSPNTIGGISYDEYNSCPDDGITLNYNYAGVGYNWDGVGFYEPQPYPSWVLNKFTYLWEPPIPYPNDGKRYFWNEDDVAWELITLPIV